MGRPCLLVWLPACPRSWVLLPLFFGFGLWSGWGLGLHGRAWGVRLVFAGFAAGSFVSCAGVGRPCLLVWLPACPRSWVLDAFLTQEPKLTAQAKEGNYQMEVAKFAFGQTVKNFIASWKVADKKWIEVAFFHRGIHNVVPIP